MFTGTIFWLSIVLIAQVSSAVRGAQAVSVIELSEENFIAKNLRYLLINLLHIMST